MRTLSTCLRNGMFLPESSGAKTSVNFFIGFTKRCQLELRLSLSPIFFLALMALKTTANAQSTTSYWNTLLPYQNNPSETSFSDGNTGFGVARVSSYELSSFVIRKTTNGGGNWHNTSLSFKINTGSNGPKNMIALPLLCVNEDVAYYGRFKTTNGGKLWYETINSPTAVFYDENNGLAGKGNQLFKTTDGGSSWTKISDLSGPSGTISNISFKGAFEMPFITVKWNANLYGFTSSDGVNFTNLGSITGGPEGSEFDHNDYIFNIKWISANRGIFLSGNTYFASGSVRTTSDGGLTWINGKTGACNLIPASSNLFLFPFGTGYCMGFPPNSACGFPSATLYKTTDYGLNWTPITLDEQRLILINAFSPSQIRASGSTGKPMSSLDGGITWSAVTSEPMAEGDRIDLSDVEMLSDQVWVARVRLNEYNGGGGSYSGSKWYVQKTTNSGDSWTDLEPLLSTTGYAGNPSPFRYVFKGLNGYRASTEGGLSYTGDGGVTWSSISIAPFATLNWVSSEKGVMPGNNRFFYFLGSGSSVALHMVTRTGTTATVSSPVFTSTAPDNPNPTITKVDFYSDDVGIAIAGNDLFKTTNGGASWFLVTPDFPIQASILVKIRLKDENTIILNRKENPTGDPLNKLFSVDLSNPSSSVEISIPGLPAGSNNSKIMDFDMVNNRGLVLTSDGTILETNNSWVSTEKIKTGSGFGNTLFSPGISISRNTTDIFYISSDEYQRAGLKSERRFYDKDLDSYGGTEFYYERPGPPLAFPFSINTELRSDCDDNDNSIHPGAPDVVCDEVDNNCDGIIDDGATFTSYFRDEDGDGFGDLNQSVYVCSDPGPGWVTNDQDCNDSDVAIAPVRWHEDVDGDGFGNPVAFVLSCENPSSAFLSYVRNNADCNDNNPVEYNSVWFLDGDQDGFGTESFEAGTSPLNVVFSCSDPSTDDVKYVRNRRDCDDSNAMKNPGQWEDNTDGIDNDCDGLVDEGDDVPGTTYCDIDEDGFGDPGCPIPPGGRPVMRNGVQILLTSNEGVQNNTDCDDTNPAINPMSFEFSDDKDNDCNGMVNDTVSLEMTWYLDSDNDGYGDDQFSQTAQTQPQGYVALGGDCNDNNAAINPGASEICGNNLDDNCNGQTDENNPVVNPIPAQEVCHLSPTTIIPLSGSAGAVFFWINPDSTIGLADSGSGSPIPSFVALNPGSTPLTVNIQVTATLQGCSSLPVSIPLTINPRPQVQAGADFAVGQNAPGVQLSGIPSGGTWTGSGLSSEGLFSTNQSVGVYPLVYCFANAQGCQGCDTLLATISQPVVTQIQKPVITPGSGIIDSPTTVSISCATPGVIIYYTTSGNIPVVGTSFTRVYTGPFSIIQSTTVRALAVLSGLPNSEVAVSFITISSPGIVATPIIAPGTGAYSGVQTVSISTTTPGASVYYTTNGNLPRLDVPNSFTKLYAGPFLVNSSQTIRAMAVKSGIQNSSIATVNLTITNPTQAVATPVISPATGLYAGPQTVTISCLTPGATIYYTTNGNIPRLDVPNGFTKVYTAPFLVNSSATVRAIATAPGMLNSPVAVSFITIGPGRMAMVGDEQEGIENQPINLSPNFPNPFSDETKIEYFIPEGSGSGLLEVFSIEGKVLYQEPVQEGISGEIKIRKGKLAPGTYFYRLKTSKNLTQPQKMIVQ